MKSNLETPCFIIKTDELEKNIRGFKSALDKYFAKNILSYSVKTNSMPYILSVMKNEECFAEVVSSDEFELASLVGFHPKSMVYNGPMKSKETFIDALQKGAYVNLETHRELEWLSDITISNNMHIGVRININLGTVNGENEDDSSRFGFSYENGELEEVVKYLRKIGVKKIGIHAHRTSKTRALEVYENICNYIVKIIQTLEIDVDFIDIGGGYYGNMPGKPTYIDYAECLYNVLSKGIELEETTVIVEPGNALIASPVDYLFSILDIKEIGDAKICLSDATRNDVDPLFHKTDYQKKIHYSNMEVEVVKKQIITGCTCLEFDKMFCLENARALNVNDKILLKCVGAYTSTLSPNFIRLIPNVYAVKDNEYKLVRKKWGAKEWIQQSIWEE